LAGNTRVFWEPDLVDDGSQDAVVVEYYSTRILTFWQDGGIEVDMDGWDTVTTKGRINEFSPLCVWSERGQWYLSHPARHGGRDYLYNCGDTAYFPLDRRKDPVDGGGRKLVRRSVHERMQWQEKEAAQRVAARERQRVLTERKYAAWLRKHSRLNYVFMEEIAEIKRRLRTNVEDEAQRERQRVRRQLWDQLMELEKIAETRRLQIEQSDRRIQELETILGLRDVTTVVGGREPRVIEPTTVLPSYHVTLCSVGFAHWPRK
jgi:hypothetical protein